ncbi:MAG: dephospho-CoA kinase [Eggerthellaceae bacterium]|nr:dephospho-CoA kinase [Eggerthellaceae bacterium]
MDVYLLIGGIGSGKSTVSALLAARGARCLDLDTIGHELLSDALVKEKLKAAFGEGICDERGAIVRKELAQAAFASTETAQTLASITHPAILSQANRLLDGLNRFGCRVAVVEASAFDGPENTDDRLLSRSNGIIAVVCDNEVRVARAMASRFDEADVRARIARQPTDDQRREWADHVIVNDGTREDLVAQVDALWAKIGG